MKLVPSYTKVLALGSSHTEEVFTGEVAIQEKVDGSQFGFGLNEDGFVVCRSHNSPLQIEGGANGMFQEGTDYIASIQDIIKTFPKDTYFYAEYLQKKKHNTLCYERVPKNHIILFDCMMEGRWVDHVELEMFANTLGVDVIPEFYRGKATKEDLQKFLETESILGKETIEGVVIKNYEQSILLGGHVFPLFTKYVREAFKERHSVDWKVRQPKGALQEFIDGFQTEARWQKAIIHAKEDGTLTQSPKDIGLLIKKIQTDVLDEETDNIKNHLFKCFKDDILRKSVSGFPEWYKKSLLENVK